MYLLPGMEACGNGLTGLRWRICVIAALLAFSGLSANAANPPPPPPPPKNHSFFDQSGYAAVALAADITALTPVSQQLARRVIEAWTCVTNSGL